MTRQTAIQPQGPNKHMRRGSIFAVLALAIGLVGCAADDSGPLWQDVQKANILEAYEGFLERYPKSGFADEARARIKTLHWDAAQATHTVDRYWTFIKRYPGDALSVEARRRASELDWPRVVQLKSVRIYRDYLSRYPDSVYASTARSRLAALAKANSLGLVKDSENVAAKIVGRRGVETAPLDAPPGKGAALQPPPAPRTAAATAGTNGRVLRAARIYFNRLPHFFYKSARGRYAIRGARRDIHYLHVELEIRPRAAFDLEISVRDRRGRRLQRYDQTLFEDGGLVFPPDRRPGFSGYPFHTPGIVYYAVEPVVRVPASGGGFVRSLWRLPRRVLNGATLNIGGNSIPLRPFAAPARRGWSSLPLDPLPGARPAGASRN